MSCKDFATSVKTYIETKQQLQELQAQCKTLRQVLQAASTKILEYMDEEELDVCRVNDGAMQLVMAESKSTRALQEERAVEQMTEILAKSTDASPKQVANTMWKHLQESREVKMTKRLKLVRS